jgi:hypothetical protein
VVSAVREDATRCIGRDAGARGGGVRDGERGGETRRRTRDDGDDAGGETRRREGETGDENATDDDDDDGSCE